MIYDGASYASEWAKAMAEGIIFLGCLSVRFLCFLCSQELISEFVCCLLVKG